MSTTEGSGDENFLGLGGENIDTEVLEFDLLGGQMSLNGTDESL